MMLDKIWVFKDFEVGIILDSPDLCSLRWWVFMKNQLVQGQWSIRVAGLMFLGGPLSSRTNFLLQVLNSDHCLAHFDICKLCFRSIVPRRAIVLLCSPLNPQLWYFLQLFYICESDIFISFSNFKKSVIRKEMIVFSYKKKKWLFCLNFYLLLITTITMFFK